MKARCEDPVFLVGCPRSGTTLLQRMLDAHSGVAIAPETHFIRRFWLRRRHYGNPAGDDNYGRLIDDVVTMPEFAEMGIGTELFRSAAMAQARGHADLFRLLLTLFADAHEAVVVGEKTPNHLLYMPTLEKFFPGARFIHIVRDPRAVVNSWRSVPWSTGSVSGDALIWRRYMASARRRPPRGRSRLLTIRYEQLVLEPTKTLSAVCRFVGIEYEAGMCAFHLGGSGTVNVAREPWKANVTRPVDPSRLEGWREELTRTMVARIEAVARGEMKRLGYAPETSRRLGWVNGPAAWTCHMMRLVKAGFARVVK